MSAVAQLRSVETMRPEPPRRSTVYEVEAELDRLVYRAKFHGDPITIEAVEKIAEEMKTMVLDDFESAEILNDIRGLLR